LLITLKHDDIDYLVELFNKLVDHYKELHTSAEKEEAQAETEKQLYKLLEKITDGCSTVLVKFLESLLEAVFCHILNNDL